MKPEIFTDAWARAWGEELNRSEIYRSAADGWEGAIVMVLQSEPGSWPAEDRPVLLDLRHGECHAARSATAEDLDAAPFVLAGLPTVWKRMLAGELEPLLALMGGNLRLTRGNVARLLPFARAAREMVAAARRIEAAYPPDWSLP